MKAIGVLAFEVLVTVRAHFCKIDGCYTARACNSGAGAGAVLGFEVPVTVWARFYGAVRGDGAGAFCKIAGRVLGRVVWGAGAVQFWSAGDGAGALWD